MYQIDPFVLLTGTYFLYTTIGSFARIGLYEKSWEVPLFFYITALVGYIALSVGYISNLRGHGRIIERKKISIRLIPSTRHYKNREGKIVVVFFLLVLAVNFPGFLNLFSNFGSGISYNEVAVRAERDAMQGPQAFLSSLFGLFLLGMVVYDIINTRAVSFLDAILLLVYGMFALTSGHRMTLINIGISIIVVINYYVCNIKWRNLFLIGILSMFMMIAIGHLRSESNIKDMIDLLSEHGSDFFLLTTSGEFKLTVGTCYSYIESVCMYGGGFDFGLSWLTEFAVFVPFFMWPGRPLPLPEQYMKIFYPEETDGTGHGWFILTDGFMAFGVIGVALEMFVLGRVLAWAYNFFMKNANNKVLFLMYLHLLCYTFGMVRNSFLGTLKNYLIQMIPFIIVYMLARKRKNHTRIAIS